MNELLVKQFDTQNIRFIQHPEELYAFGILAEDLAIILDHSNSRMLSNTVDTIWKGVSNVYTPGGTQSMSVIWEPGVYQILSTSRKPKAKPFQIWLFEEVLPSIRKTGSYSTQPPILSTAQMFLQTAQVLVEHEQALKQQDLRLQAIESRFVGIEADIAELPEPPEKVPAKSLRAALNQLVKGYAYHNKTGYPEAWRRLYSEYLSIYGIDLKARSKKLQCSTVEYAEHTGHLNTLYSVAHQLFTPRILDSKPIYTEAV